MENNINEGSVFQSLIGEQLSSVCFVQDYMQIDFDGHMLTTYTVPVIVVGTVDVLYSHQHYKNEICNFIAKRVVNVKYKEDESVEIIFEGTSDIIKVILDVTVDNIYYTDNDDNWFVI